MEKNRKREIAREYRERKQETGIYALRCKPSGEVWVAASLNLDKQQNGLWFALRLGKFPNAAIQAAWNTHGEAAFAYEVVEQVRDDNAQLIGILLKERDLHWRKALGAQPVVG